MKTVEAVKSLEQVKEVETLLKHHHGALYADLWRLGVNLALRISDLLSLKYAQLEGDSLYLIEGKTGKSREIRLNSKALEIIRARREEFPKDTYLFQLHTNRSQGKPPSRKHVAFVFMLIGEKMKIKLGTHSMRKTRGYVMFKDGVPIEKISKVLNHKSTSTTLAYIGIEREDIQATYDDYVI